MSGACRRAARAGTPASCLPERTSSAPTQPQHHTVAELEFDIESTAYLERRQLDELRHHLRHFRPACVTATAPVIERVNRYRSRRAKRLPRLTARLILCDQPLAFRHRALRRLLLTLHPRSSSVELYPPGGRRSPIEDRITRRKTSQRDRLRLICFTCRSLSPWIRRIVSGRKAYAFGWPLMRILPF